MGNSGFTPPLIFMNKIFGKKLRRGKLVAGFTIFEVVVVIGIMVIISSVILTTYPNFNDRVSTRRAAEEIASSVRQAQAYGLGVKESGTGSADFPGYGLYFQSASPFTYIFFADKIRDLQYAGDSEKISEITIQGKASIVDLCANQKQAVVGPCGLSELRAIFLRPQPQVNLKSGSLSYSDVEIKIKGPRGTQKTIIFWLSGQVSIE